MAMTAPRLRRGATPVLVGNELLFIGGPMMRLSRGASAALAFRVAGAVDGTRTPDELARVCGVSIDAVTAVLDALDRMHVLAEDQVLEVVGLSIDTCFGRALGGLDCDVRFVAHPTHAADLLVVAAPTPECVPALVTAAGLHVAALPLFEDPFAVGPLIRPGDPLRLVERGRTWVGRLPRELLAVQAAMDVARVLAGDRNPVVRRRLEGDELVVETMSSWGSYGRCLHTL
jgi:hypothetical protein